MNYTIGDTPILRDIAQSKRGDYLWTLHFVDVATDGTETDTDLTNCDFAMVILDQDGTTPKKTLSVGDGIAVVGNDVTISMSKTEYAAWTKGCAYPYYLTYTNAANFTKCLFEGKFTTT